MTNHHQTDKPIFKEEQNKKNFFYKTISIYKSIFSDKTPEIISDNQLYKALNKIGRIQKISFKYRPHLQSLPFNEQLQHLLDDANIRKRKVFLENDWWKISHGPLLAFLKKDHIPVALIPTKENAYSLYNPQTNTETKITASLANQLVSEAFVFYRPFAHRKIGLKYLKYFLTSGQKRNVWKIMLLGIGGGILGLLVPLMIGFLFDSAIPSADRLQIWQMFLALCAGAFGIAAFSLTRRLTQLSAEGQMDLAFQAGIWDRLLRLPMTFFYKYNASDLTRRIIRSGIIRKTISQQITNSVVSTIFSVFNFMILFYFSAKLAN